MPIQRLPAPSSGIAKTNPVWSFTSFEQYHPNRSNNPAAANRFIEQWVREAIQSGVTFPASIRRRYRHLFKGIEMKTTESRVVGLLVRHQAGEAPLGLVTPLKATVNKSGRSIVSRFLPFDELHLRRAIDQLICGNTNSPPSPFPVLLSFQVEEQLNDFAHGDSMDIAGVLALIDACSGHSSTLLRSACAVVAPHGNSLKEVEYVDVKLTAFRREVGDGSLLICERGGWAAQHCKHDFEVVWEVSTFEDLRKELIGTQLLQPMFDDAQLTSSKFETAKRYLDFLELTYDAAVALDYARRIEQHSDGSSLKIRLDLASRQADLNRHIGNTSQGIHYASLCVSELEAVTGFTSFQQLCHAQVLVAAGLYDQHAFSRARDLLTPLHQRANERDDLIDAAARVELNNTLGRCLVMLGEEGWENLFLESLQIQQVIEPENLSRTGCYLIYGYLRCNRLADALSRLEKFASHAAENKYLRFYAQDYLRRGGQQHECIDQILRTPNVGGGHALGMFLQARARAQQDATAAASDFREAENAFACECLQQDPSNLLHLFKQFMKMAAASCEGDLARFKDAEQVISAYFGSCSNELRTWYQPFIPHSPDRAEIEVLLNRSPYF